MFYLNVQDKVKLRKEQQMTISFTPQHNTTQQKPIIGKTKNQNLAFSSNVGLCTDLGFRVADHFHSPAQLRMILEAKKALEGNNHTNEVILAARRQFRDTDLVVQVCEQGEMHKGFVSSDYGLSGTHESGVNAIVDAYTKARSIITKELEKRAEREKQQPEIDALLAQLQR